MKATPKQLAALRKARAAKAAKTKATKATKAKTTTRKRTTARKRSLSGVAESKPNMNSALREMIRVKNLLTDNLQDNEVSVETLRTQCGIAADRLDNAINCLQVAIVSIA